jgi:threonine/homoserine/homoserine lactone efflux protein
LLPIWSFLAVTVPLVASPGVSTTVVLRNSIAGGARAGVLTAVGCNAGNLAYGVLTAFGFAVTLQHWPSVWLVLRVTGVCYLAWLGFRSVVRAVRADRPRGVSSEGAREGWRSVTSGFIANALNPSLAAFYLIILPQFIPVDVPFARSALILSAIHVALAFTWHSVWAVAGSTMARVLSTGVPRRTLDLLASVALIWLAAKLAF